MELNEIEKLWQKQEEKRIKEDAEKISQAKFVVEKPPLFSNAIFEKLDLPDIQIQKLKFWFEDPIEPMLFVGAPGTGKTFAAYACIDYLCRIAFERFKKRIKEAYQLSHFNNGTVYSAWNVSQLYQRWLKTFKQDHYDDYFLKSLSECRYLLLDDIGTREPSPAFLDFLYCIVNERIENQLATIFTTNISAEEMEKMFGDRMVSRILSGTQIMFDGEDRRMKKVKGKS